MTKTQMRKETRITTGTLAKLEKNENVNTEVLVKICNALHCDISDIMELTEEGVVNQAWKEPVSGSLCSF